MRQGLGSSVSAVALAVLGLILASGGSAVALPKDTLVSQVAASGTPHVLQGRVLSVTQVGNTILLGGEFATARNDGSTTVLNRANLLAFDATTGQISTTFVPQPNGAVQKVLDAGDGQTVYVGGNFTSLGGVSRSRVARIRISDGSVVPTFNPGTITGQVRDMALREGRLWVGGAFTHLGGSPQRALATLDPTTGARTGYMSSVIAGIHNSGVTQVLKFDLTPNGDRLAAVGNFDTLSGVREHQLMVLDTSGAAAAPSTFHTSFYTQACSQSFDSYMRDVDFSPDGSFFVVSTTGAYGGSNAPCDTTARFETKAAGADVAPSWVNYTGGDTTYGVEITDTAVYVGGHFRWQNNAFRGDAAGQGAVPREGLAALDPSNGLPYSWNPGRTKGVGVFDFLAASNGLWVASDTDRIANQLRSRIARMRPDGVTVQPITTPTVPNDLYLVGNDLARRAITATTLGARTPLPDGGINWSAVRGAFMVNGWLHTAMADGSFVRRRFDGTTFGAAEPVNGAEQLVTFSDWRSDAANATGMFFDAGRIYFTRAGSSQLFYRYFTPESGVVGAKRLVAASSSTDINFASVRGLFGTGTQLYWADTSGRLNRMDWRRGDQSGAPVPGTNSVVSGPAVDQTNWSSRAYFLFQDAQGHGSAPNQPPVASFTSSCTGLTCTFDAGASYDPDGSVAQRAWDFGDGATDTGGSVTHTYPSAGPRTVTLNLTDNRGATGSHSAQVDPQPLPAAHPEFVGAAVVNTNSTTSAVAIPHQVRAGDVLVLRLAVNSSTPTVTDPAGWTLLRTASAGNVQGRLWTRTATADDAGRVVSTPLSTIAKAELGVSAYRADHGGVGVTDSALSIAQGGGPQFTAPAVTASADSWVSTSWVAKTSVGVTWAAPSDSTVRSSTTGAGGGAVSGLMVDTGADVPAGAWPGAVATADPNPGRVVMSTVVLTPN